METSLTSMDIFQITKWTRLKALPWNARGTFNKVPLITFWSFITDGKMECPVITIQLLWKIGELVLYVRQLRCSYAAVCREGKAHTLQSQSR